MNTPRRNRLADLPGGAAAVRVITPADSPASRESFRRRPRDRRPRRAASPPREKDVHARSEPHQADAFAAFEHLTFADPTHDPARQDSNHLPEHDGLSVVVDPDFIQLVVVRPFVVGRQKLAGAIVDARDTAGDRRAVDVHIHRRQKNRDLLPRPGRRPAPSLGPAIITRPSAGDTTSPGLAGCAARDPGRNKP